MDDLHCRGGMAGCRAAMITPLEDFPVRPVLGIVNRDEHSIAGTLLVAHNGRRIGCGTGHILPRTTKATAMKTSLDRRAVLGLGAATLAGLPAGVRAASLPTQMQQTGGQEVIPLWPNTPPGGEDVKLSLTVVERSPEPSAYHHREFTNVAIPTLSVFRPERPDGSALLVIPGGAYTVVVFDNEGVDVARALNGYGVTAFVLLYRLPAEGWRNQSDVPLQDTQRAMRLIRAGADRFAIDPARVGVLGFSAGGHMAATLATRSGKSVYGHVDRADDLDARPSFAGLMYPVITMFEGTHGDSRHKLLGAGPPLEQLAAYSCERNVTHDTPPTFLCLTADDNVVPYIPNGMAMFDALRAAEVPAELHVFQEGGHGFGIRHARGRSPALWPDLFAHWAYRNGWLRSPAAQPG